MHIHTAPSRILGIFLPVEYNKFKPFCPYCDVWAENDCPLYDSPKEKYPNPSTRSMNMKKYIIALDQGLPAPREPWCSITREAFFLRPKRTDPVLSHPGYLEQDPWNLCFQSGVLAEVMAKGDLSGRNRRNQHLQSARVPFSGKRTPADRSTMQLLVAVPAHCGNLRRTQGSRA